MAPIQQCSSPLLLLPPELRSMIYEYLLPPSFDNDMLIETWEAPSILTKCPPKDLRRTTYATYDRSKSYHAPAYLTTYRVSRKYREDNGRMCPEIMAVNRLINHETSYYLYGSRCFHFKHHLNALSAFVEDLRPSTRALMQRVSLHLTLPGSPFSIAARYDGYDNSEFWPDTALALQSLPALRGLAIKVKGLCPPNDETLWTQGLSSQLAMPERPSPKPTVEILNYLCHTGDKSVCWMRELLPLSSLEDLVIWPSITSDQRLTRASITREGHNYALISAHMGTTMIEFMKNQGLPARVTTEKEARRWSCFV